jgi:PhoD-like phosphatase
VPTDLDDYRILYRGYLADPDLQDARARWPFVCIWDNHELSWKGWQSQVSFGSGVVPAQTRKVAANQVTVVLDARPDDPSLQAGAALGAIAKALSGAVLPPAEVRLVVHPGSRGKIKDFQAPKVCTLTTGDEVLAEGDVLGPKGCPELGDRHPPPFSERGLLVLILDFRNLRRTARRSSSSSSRSTSRRRVATLIQVRPRSALAPIWTSRRRTLSAQPRMASRPSS